MPFLLSVIPILFILVMMVGLQWSAARAGAVGYLSALLIAALFFGAGTQLLAYAHVRAFFLSLDVLLIIWTAFLLFRVADDAGAIRTIGNSLPHLTSDRGLQALIIGWVFAAFLQAVGGFGVPVAVTAPLLVGLGFPPLQAVLIPSIGHGWGVTFGSLGIAFQSLLVATGLPVSVLGPPSAIVLGAAAVFSGLLVAQATGGWNTLRRLLAPVLVLGAVMAVVQYLTVLVGLWNLGVLLASLAGMLIAFPMARRLHGDSAINGELEVRNLILALAGYAMLVIIILAVQYILPLKQALGQVVLSVKIPQVSTGAGIFSQAVVTPAGSSRAISVFNHMGAILVYASILTYLLYHKAGFYQPGALRRILDSTSKAIIAPSVSIVSMLTMAVIMENSGMTERLARGLAEGAGMFFPVISPWIGALGAFMTGSNVNSNMVFAALQMRTAELLKVSIPIILAAQTAGGSIGSAMAPTKVVVGASTAGMAGKEGEVMRHLVLYIALQVLLVSILTILGVWFYS